MATQELLPEHAYVKSGRSIDECENIRSLSGGRSTTAGSSSPDVSFRNEGGTQARHLYPTAISPGLEMESDNGDEGEMFNDNRAQPHLESVGREESFGTPRASHGMMCSGNVGLRHRSLSSASLQTKTWTSSVLDVLAQTQSEQGFLNRRHGLEPLTPTSVVRALGCQDLLDTVHIGSNCRSSSTLVSPLIPAAGLRSSPSSAASHSEAVAAQLCRRAVPGLDMARVKMDYDNDEESVDDEAFLRSCLKHDPASLACGSTSSPCRQRSEVPQLRIPSLVAPSDVSRSGEYGGHSSCYTPNGLNEANNVPSPPSRVSPPLPSNEVYGCSRAPFSRTKFTPLMGRRSCGTGSKWDTEGSLIHMDRSLSGSMSASCLSKGQTRLPQVSMSRSASGMLDESENPFGSTSRCRWPSQAKIGKQRKATIFTHVHTHHHLHHHVVRSSMNANVNSGSS